MDLINYMCWHSKLENALQNLFIEMQFDYKSKYIAQIIYNKTFFLPK
jgi:hypothetical protein